MNFSHVAHDCRLGSYIIIANASLLGGHVRMHDHASLSGGVAVHHYATIGSYSFTAGISRVLHDVPPYMLCEGQPARPRCINVVALKRNEFEPEIINCLAEAHRLHECPKCRRLLYVSAPGVVTTHAVHLCRELPR